MSGTAAGGRLRIYVDTSVIGGCLDPEFAATLAEVDVLVSWNFKHVVNLKRIKGFNAVNLGMGLRPLEIRTPREVVGDDD